MELTDKYCCDLLRYWKTSRKPGKEQATPAGLLVYPVLLTESAYYPYKTHNCFHDSEIAQNVKDFFKNLFLV